MTVKAWFNRHFGHLNLIRHLRPRIMTMILVLMIPLVSLCLVLSVVSILNATKLNYDIQNYVMNMMLSERVAVLEAKDIDPAENYPETLADVIAAMIPMASENGGEIYTACDEQTVWHIGEGGIYTQSELTWQEVWESRYTYRWTSKDGRMKTVVVFPHNFALAHISPWYWVGVVVSALALLMCPVLYGRLKKDVLEPLNILQEGMGRLENDTAYRIKNHSPRYAVEFLDSFDGFDQMAEEVQRSHEKDIKMLEAEIDNLRLQVNPHMLLNSYNMIYALAESKNYAVIQNYTLCLVDYFRYVLRRGEKMVTVQQELDFVDNFIRIQRIRFPGRFSYVYQAEGECLNALIPPLLIENFVENAIKYALEPGKPIEIVVSIRTEADDAGKEKLHISIMDTGSGIRPEVLEKLKAHEPYVDEAGHKHIGIWNCVRRVELFYGEEGTIHFTSAEGQGTQIYLIVPYTQEESA